MSICSNPRCGDPKPEDTERCSRCEALLVDTLVRGRYKIVKQVGKGGFGITYLVEDKDCFAAKRILKELCPMPFLNSSEEKPREAGEIAERLFHREAKILLNLSHPGIPKLYAYFNDGDYSYLVQDYIPGQTLSEELSQRKQVFSERQVCELMLELAEILEYLHSQEPPIIHRDIKPQNLMRHSNGKLQLIDFGAVYQAVNARASSETLIGSPGYAPPEQIFGEPVPQSDLYATGATMLRLLTGIHPSKLFNNATKRMEWETKVKVSSGVAQLLRELLAVNIRKRLRSATELKHRLQTLLQDIKREEEQKQTLRFTRREELDRESISGDVAAVDEPGADVASRLENSQDVELLYSFVDKVPEEAGTLSQMPFPYLLCRIYRDRLSCRLTCTLGEMSKTIYFDQGAVVFARSNQRDDRLGETLMRLGRLSKEDFDTASELMRTHNLRFGSALIKMGKIGQEDLKPLLTEQVREIVYSLFEWGEGSYEVRQEEPRKRSVSISLSCADIVFEGLRRMTNLNLVKNWLGDFSWKLSITSDPLLLYQSFNLTPKEGFIVSRIENEMSVDEILSLGGLPEDETLKTICGLLAVGILRWVDKNSLNDSYSEPIARVLSTHVQQPNFDIQGAAAFCYEVENMLSTVKNANHYAVLDLPRSATPEQIHTAYTQLARKFHPDRHAQLAEYNLSLRADLEKIFARVMEAYSVLSDPERRKEYDNSFKTIGVAKFSQRPPVSEVHESAAVELPRVLPQQPPVELSVPAQLSKPPTLKTSSVVEKPAKPDTHKTPLGDPASVWFDRGFKYYTSFQFKQACHAFQAAVDSDPNCASYRIFLARSLAQFKGHNSRAKEHFCRAIELEPNNPEYLAEVGLFLQKLGMNKEAEQMFDRALKIIPNHPIARRAKTERR